MEVALQLTLSRRVAQTLNGVTTYFVGSYYEETGSVGTPQHVVTKYYFAGSTRVAMRTDDDSTPGTTLNFLLSDHLGSTSLTLNASGSVISEMRYKPWGEVRYNAGTTPTNYTYTGQYSNTADFGLMYYGARWYDPYINRFAQADSIVPAGVQGYDRYAYASNSPLVYSDPSGHCSADVSLLAPGISQLISCIKDIGDAINAYKSGERDAIKLASTATGFDDWASETGTRVNQLNAHVDTVFSNAPVDQRLPAAVDVGLFSVTTAANIIGGVQLARGISAFSRSGDFTKYAVDGTEFSYDRPVGDKLYRVWGGKSPQQSIWTSTQNPGNQITAIRSGALPPGNWATTVSEVEIVSATNAETSIAAPMFGQPGGITQVRLSSLDGVIFSAGKHLPIGVMPVVPWNMWCAVPAICN